MRVLLALTVVTVVGLAGTPTLADEVDGIGKIKIGVPSAVTPVPNSAQPCACKSTREVDATDLDYRF